MNGKHGSRGDELAHRSSLSNSDVTHRTSGGAHRKQPSGLGVQGRVAAVALAAGATSLSGAVLFNHSSGGQNQTAEVPRALIQDDVASVASPQALSEEDIARAAAPLIFNQQAKPAAEGAQSPSLSAAAPVAQLQAADIAESLSDTLLRQLESATKTADEKEQAEVEARRPKLSLPALGTFTSGFGARWGALHAGVDIANAIGTPIWAVADGTVIDSGPADGFGLWIRIKHDDGAISTYGHINTNDVTVGQKVKAGDQIATMGNRGFSTGPHLHFEIQPDGKTKIDPLIWFTQKGYDLIKDIAGQSGSALGALFNPASLAH